jgi:hypothetical protein
MARRRARKSKKKGGWMIVGSEVTVRALCEPGGRAGFHLGHIYRKKSTALRDLRTGNKKLAAKGWDRDKLIRWPPKCKVSR